MSINTNNQDIKIDDELQSLAIQKGKKLGLLISELKIDDETRQAFLDLLPSLTLEQIEKLIDTLEVKYLDAATRSEDKKFEEELIKIKEEYTKKQEEIDKETIKQLEELEKVLDQK
jgi:hypothetical protein